MFSNFIYFIVVLLIFSTYQPSDETGLSTAESFIFFMILTLLFAFFTRLLFRRLEKSFHEYSLPRLEHAFNTIVTRQSVLAIVLFAIDIYILNLKSILINSPVFSKSPTLHALVFIGLFIFYLSIIWGSAHKTYQRLQRQAVSRRSYIISNISFSVPVLIPWLFLSGIMDTINALPFDFLKNLLSTTAGELVFFLVFLILVAITGPVMIQKLWGCIPLEKGFHRSKIEAMSSRAGIRYNNIVYWPIFGGSMITAGIMGLVAKARYILVTKALLRFLGPEEFDSVIAHELGHVKKNHLLFYVFFFIGYIFLSYASFDLVLFSLYYSDLLYGFINHTRLNPATVFSTLFSIITIIIFLIYFRFIFGYFMRNFERQADAYVYTFFDTAGHLVSTFNKISLYSGQSPDKPSWHHFSIKERIDFLLKCETDRSWIKRHDMKIKKSIAVYVAAMILLGSLGYHISYGTTGKKLNDRVLIKATLRKIEQTPDNPRLYNLLGDLHYNEKKYFETIEAYEKTIALDRYNAHALNNLAWCFATCDDPGFRNPEQALLLAIRAAGIKRQPHILDTLAESYFVNGRYKDAILIEQEVLEMDRKNSKYYESQLNKFNRAMEEK